METPAGETADTVAAPAVVPPGGRRRLARSTAIFSLATGLSRVLGLVREVVASYYFGASGRINAFTIAWQFPNLVRALVADAALSSAFVPVFSELIEKGGKRRFQRGVHVDFLRDVQRQIFNSCRGRDHLCSLE